MPAADVEISPRPATARVYAPSQAAWEPAGHTLHLVKALKCCVMQEGAGSAV